MSSQFLDKPKQCCEITYFNYRISLSILLTLADFTNQTLISVKYPTNYMIRNPVLVGVGLTL